MSNNIDVDRQTYTKTDGHKGRWTQRKMDTKTDGHKDTQTERQTDMQTYTQTYTQTDTDTHIDRQTDIQVHRQTSGKDRVHDELNIDELLQISSKTCLIPIHVSSFVVEHSF